MSEANTMTIRKLFAWLGIMGQILFQQMDANAHDLVGFFETKPGVGGARNRLCITRLSDRRLDIYLATSYCPSKSGECYNPRLDAIGFQARPKDRKVIYKDAAGCEITIRFLNDLAKVTQSNRCVSDDHPFLYAAGSYTLMKPAAEESDCGP
jgi:hypothetical protein